MSTPTNGFTPQTKKELLQQYIKTADDIILLNMLRMVDMSIGKIIGRICFRWYPSMKKKGFYWYDAGCVEVVEKASK